MTLLFDENLSHKLPLLLAKEFPGCLHVRDIGLLGASDKSIWNHCLRHQLTLVSKDTDFLHRKVSTKAAPKVIWLNVGNANTQEIAAILQKEHRRVVAFHRQAGKTRLELPTL